MTHQLCEAPENAQHVHTDGNIPDLNKLVDDILKDEDFEGDFDGVYEDSNLRYESTSENWNEILELSEELEESWRDMRLKQKTRMPLLWSDMFVPSTDICGQLHQCVQSLNREKSSTQQSLFSSDPLRLRNSNIYSIQYSNYVKVPRFP